MGQEISTNLQLSWERIPGAVSPGSRDGSALVSIGDAVYLFGGNAEAGQQRNDVWRFDVQTRVWSQVEPSTPVRPSARAGSACVGLGVNLLVFGGLDADRGWLDELWQFDTVTRVWTLMVSQGEAPCARDKAAAVAVGGNLVLFGGFGPSVTQEVDAAAGGVALPDPMIQGDDQDDDDDDDGDDDDDDQEDADDNRAAAEFRWFNDLYVWNIARGAWRRVICQNALPVERAAHGMFLMQGRLWIFGGKCSVGGRQNDLWSIGVQDILSPEGCPAWIPVTLQSGVAPVGRSFHAACAFGSRAIVFGGISDADIHLCDTHIFDFALQSFAQPPTLNPTAAPCARASAAVTCLGNFMYLYGGSSAQDVVHSDFYRLDLTSVASAEMKLPTPSQ